MILSTFRTLLKGTVFLVMLLFFWTYAIIFRINTFSGKVFDPWAHSGRDVGFKVPRLSAKTTILELSAGSTGSGGSRGNGGSGYGSDPPYTRAGGKDDGSYKLCQLIILFFVHLTSI